MTIRFTGFGGSDYNNENITDADFNDTNNYIAKNIVDSNIALGDRVVSGCVVAEQSVPNQTVKMSSGTIILNGLTYEIDAEAIISLTAADTTYNRYDLISINSSGNVVVTDGTPSTVVDGIPLKPDIPTSNIGLVYVFRAPSDNVINTVDIDLEFNVTTTDGWTLVGKKTAANENLLFADLPLSYTTYKVVLRDVIDSSFRLEINNGSGHSYTYIENGVVLQTSGEPYFILGKSGVPFSGELMIGLTSTFATVSGSLYSRDGTNEYVFLGGHTNNIAVTSSIFNFSAGFEGTVEIWGKE